MPQQFMFPTLALAAVLALSGCWLWQKATPQQPDPPGSRLAAWSLDRLGVVEFGDVTHQNVGMRHTMIFQRELGQRVGPDRIVFAAPPADTTAAQRKEYVGLVGIGTARKLGATHQVDGLVAGNVLAHAWQRRQARILVTVAVRLLDANRGSIIWSRTATGAASVRDASSAQLEAGYDEAITKAAKEFIDDLLASPSQARATRDGDRRRRHRNAA